MARTNSDTNHHKYGNDYGILFHIIQVLLYSLKNHAIVVSPVVAALSAKDSERVVGNPQKNTTQQTRN